MFQMNPKNFSTILHSQFNHNTIHCRSIPLSMYKNLNNVNFLQEYEKGFLHFVM